MALRIRMLGRFDVKNGERLVHGVDRRGQELLAYLLLNRDRPQTRESVASRLWPDLPPQLTRKYLRQAIWAANAGARGTAGKSSRTPSTNHETAEGPPGLIVTDGDLLRAAPDAWLDLAEFEHAFDATCDRSGASLDADTATAVQDAVALYKGDLLDGWYVDWCEDDRHRAQTELLAMLDKLVAYHRGRGAVDAAIAAGLRILGVDPARERTHRQVMRLRYEAGDRTGAIRQYQACVDALTRELGVRPSRRTIELYRQIKADRLDEVSPVFADPSHGVRSTKAASSKASPAAPPTSRLGGLLDSLREMRDALDGLERRVEREIRSVEDALRRRYDDD
jgi:DNA-binding SARP family transcriptional activator